MMLGCRAVAHFVGGLGASALDGFAGTFAKYSEHVVLLVNGFGRRLEQNSNRRSSNVLDECQPRPITYRVGFNVRARKQLKKRDRPEAKILTTWIKNNLAVCANPRTFARA
ncbi:hypothetical protein HMPREF3104_09380 [Corynebacterium sp. HMSC30G07]|nr:hypothetical protein HMPREF3104_09380 [Corynebacterium sp. HMSC30G07]